MQENLNGRLVLSAMAQNLLRILIASYFLAGAVGLVSGTSLVPLFSRMFPLYAAQPIATCVVFLLAYLVMLGIWLRGAALTLGILTFWASYFRMMDLGMATELEGFWRDLALIAALILTYAETDPRNHAKRAVVRDAPDENPRPAPDKTKLDTRPEPAISLRAADFSTQSKNQRDAVSIEELEQLFHEEFEVARSH